MVEQELKNIWEEWKTQHSKKYDTQEEHDYRFKIWSEADAFIKKHKSEKHSYEIGHNKFSDLTTEEFSKNFKGFDAQQHALKQDSSNFKLSAVELPESVDWRTQGYVNPIQDQGQCGSCYTFSACASIEGQYFKANGTLVKLSEQNLVDCSSKFGNNGGDGGTMDNCFTYVKENGGIDSEESYPYQAEALQCKYNPTDSAAKVSGFVDVPQGDENALATAIATIGPISVGIDASQRSFQLYKSGIYDDPACTQTPDHAVVCVGYGTEGPDKDFYIVRNSWGTVWGDMGYIKMARNKDNLAGIANMASYPLVVTDEKEEKKNAYCNYL